MNPNHEAKISKSDPEKESFVRGTFEYANGELSFQCSTQNVEFDYVKKAIEALKNECQRQIDNQSKCPFSPQFKKVKNVQ